MIEIKFTKSNIQTDSYGTPLINMGEQGRTFYEEMKVNKTYVAEIKLKREKRSHDANAYCWVLCKKIADKLGLTKLEVYRHAIRDVGIFIPMMIPTVDFPEAKRTWEGDGTNKKGWLMDVELAGKEFISVHAYKGSSVYNSKEMSILIDHIIREAKEIGIETATPDELEKMKRSWK